MNYRRYAKRYSEIMADLQRSIEANERAVQIGEISWERQENRDTLAKQQAINDLFDVLADYEVEQIAQSTADSDRAEQTNAWGRQVWSGGNA